jgi:hypothetical protein
MLVINVEFLSLTAVTQADFTETIIEEPGASR